VGDLKGENMSWTKKLVAVCVAVAMLSAAGVAGATLGAIKIKGAGPGAAVLKCPGGMTRLGHDLAADMTVFAGDPAVTINSFDIEQFFWLDEVSIGSHAGTHFDAPYHFNGTEPTVDDLNADNFVWPVYKMDVRGMEFDGGLIEKADIRAYEQDNGRIPNGALVVLQTGNEEFWGTGGEFDESISIDGFAYNIDDFFYTYADVDFNTFPVVDDQGNEIGFKAAGFSGAAVEWMLEKRSIDGLGSDAYGPDAWSDANFSATDTILDNGGVAVVALANLDAVNVRGDIMIANTVALADGSGFPTDPIACHASPGNGNGNGDDMNDDDDDDDDDQG